MNTGTGNTPAGHGRRIAAVACGLLLVVGLALVGVALTHQVNAPEAKLTSAAQAEAEAATTPSASPSQAAPSHSASPAPSHSASAKPSAAPSPSHRPGLPASRPVRVDIPSIGVTSSLQKLGLDTHGAIEVPHPPHYNEAGWFTGSPTPGQTGPAVILGHIDGVGTTPSIFFKLGAVKNGDVANVTRADGRVVTFTVYRVERYAKDDFPTGVVYGNTAGPELRLITCGGTVDQSTGHYRDNTVVYAKMTAVHR